MNKVCKRFYCWWVFVLSWLLTALCHGDDFFVQHIANFSQNPSHYYCVDCKPDSEQSAGSDIKQYSIKLVLEFNTPAARRYDESLCLCFTNALNIECHDLDILLKYNQKDYGSNEHKPVFCYPWRSLKKAKKELVSFKRTETETESTLWILKFTALARTTPMLHVKATKAYALGTFQYLTYLAYHQSPKLPFRKNTKQWVETFSGDDLSHPRTEEVQYCKKFEEIFCLPHHNNSDFRDKLMLFIKRLEGGRLTTCANIPKKTVKKAARLLNIEQWHWFFYSTRDYNEFSNNFDLITSKKIGGISLNSTKKRSKNSYCRSAQSFTGDRVFPTNDREYQPVNPPAPYFDTVNTTGFLYEAGDDRQGAFLPDMGQGSNNHLSTTDANNPGSLEELMANVRDDATLEGINAPEHLNTGNTTVTDDQGEAEATGYQPIDDSARYLSDDTTLRGIDVLIEHLNIGNTTVTDDQGKATGYQSVSELCDGDHDRRGVFFCNGWQGSNDFSLTATPFGERSLDDIDKKLDLINKTQGKKRGKRKQASASLDQQRLAEAKWSEEEQKLAGGKLPEEGDDRQYSLEIARANSVCKHYERNCKVKFPCCLKFYGCHRCHNKSDECEKDDNKARDATHMQCRFCGHEQEIGEDSQQCSVCDYRMSAYFCATCKHFTSGEYQPYHCEPCGICRVYKNRSFHCHLCNICLDKRLKDKHRCRPNSGHDECCICLEDAFSGCQILPCSHKVHRECAIAMIQNGVSHCPICRRHFRSDAPPPKRR
ncbi:CHY zinc finger protein [Candidatus Sororendozoicomonas aggregata]|uniref:CHY zinc finger protein n=1 Tax=Candidatus Sororendozoicomonas aggregata TaxID=3073239 RepID=UPI002ED2FD50